VAIINSALFIYMTLLKLTVTEVCAGTVLFGGKILVILDE